MKNLSLLLIGSVVGAIAVLSIPYARADVDNPYAVATSNEIVRPMAEEFRDLYYKSLAIKNDWTLAKLNANFPVSGGPILDGRDDINAIDSDDARKILIFLNTFTLAYEAEGISEMTLPCVRQLQVN